MVQAGSRNMQNTHLLKIPGDTRIPVLLKLGFGCYVDEWLAAGETKYVPATAAPSIAAEADESLVEINSLPDTASVDSRKVLDEARLKKTAVLVRCVSSAINQKIDKMAQYLESK